MGVNNAPKSKSSHPMLGKSYADDPLWGFCLYQLLWKRQSPIKAGDWVAQSVPPVYWIQFYDPMQQWLQGWMPLGWSNPFSIEGELVLCVLAYTSSKCYSSTNMELLLLCISFSYSGAMILSLAWWQGCLRSQAARWYHVWCECRLLLLGRGTVCCTVFVSV